MKKSIVYIIALSFVLGSCAKKSMSDFDILKEKIASKGASSGKTIKYVCDGVTSLPTGFQCLANSGGAKNPFRFTETKVLGTWYSSSYDVCITYKSDGTGVARFKGGIGFPASSTNIKWGIWVNSTGKEINASANHWYIMHQGIGDPQIELMSYNYSSGAPGESFGFVKQSCPF
ncbi:MAG: hypothetical protein CFE21_04905 [Bacteroidetes bacterium B1(2017)]|nr:MAG: hypothetical protein CFE21_04905 [Bacteroidetes bacterium B1(2017)]